MEQSTKKEQNKLGIMPIPRLLLTMSLPAIFSMIIQALYNVVDSIFVAQLGEASLTAVSLAFPIQIVIISCFVGMGVGINSSISRRLGQHKKSEAENVSEHGFLVALFLAVAIGVMGFLAAEPFIGLFTNDAAIIAQGRDYIMVVTVFSFGSIFTQAAFATLQGSGEMIKPMIGQIIGAVSNIILDPIMIFGLLGMPALGVKGAAIATVIGQCLAMLYILLVLFKGKNNLLKLNFAKFSFQSKIIKDIVVVGLPAAIMQGLGSVMITGYNLILSGFGMSAVAVFGVYFRIQSFIFMPVFGLGQGAMPIFGFNFGAKNKSRFNETLKVAASAALAIMVVGMIVFWLFPQQLLILFNPSPEMKEIAVHCFRSISLGFPIAGVSIMISTSFQAMGKAYISMIASFIRQIICLLPISWLLSQIGGLELVWYGFVIAEVVCIAYQLWMLKRFESQIMDQWAVPENAYE
ncbi:MATE family efflux transporter [Eubacteriaceae bacterium ES2]|nr:MATE family efflux transporter [Eubacteriaceae bacterium ES2]